jgi:hypothetical protein
VLNGVCGYSPGVKARVAGVREGKAVILGMDQYRRARFLAFLDNLCR